jgi:uncharacterized protein YndB with AHSA1/START domain
MLWPTFSLQRKENAVMPETAAKTKTDHQLQVRKIVPASREEVFDAWLNPKSLSTWMTPGPVTGAPAEIDGRVGGKFKIDMQSPGGNYLHTGVYRKVDRPRLLEFTWNSPATNGEDSIVTVEFNDRAGQTEVVLTHRLLPSADSAKNHEQGWTDILGKLATNLRKN